MGLNDEREKLNQAWEWLETAPFDGEHYLAAYGYILEFSPDERQRLIETDRKRLGQAYAYLSDSEGNLLL